MPDSPVSESRIKRQAVVFYCVLLLWPAYLFFLPYMFARFGYFSLIYIIFPGAYLFTWVGFLMHESWHKYVPDLNHAFFYNAFALMLPSDPQVYYLVHGYHHSQIHSYQDMEFHPTGEIKSRTGRIVLNWLEFFLGAAFLEVAASLQVPRDRRFAGKYRMGKLVSSILAISAFLGGIGFLSAFAFGVTPFQIVIPLAISLWFNSFLLHQSQLVEHGNLIVEGPFRERTLWTRNLAPAGWAEKVFLFLTHNDSREHVLHHTMPSYYLRPFPGVVPLPGNAVYITFRDYWGIAARMLAGKVDRIVPPLPESGPPPVRSVGGDVEEGAGG